MPSCEGGVDAKGVTEVVRRQKRARISCSATESEQGHHRVETPKRPTSDSPTTTGEDRDNIGGMDKDARRGVVGRTLVACGEQLTPSIGS